MGCILTTSKDDKGRKKKQGQIEEIVVFVPGFRIPKSIDFGRLLHGYLSASMVEQLSALRTRIVVMAAEECQSAVKAKKTATQHGGSTFSDLQQALEDYLPSLLGLTTKGNCTGKFLVRGVICAAHDGYAVFIRSEFIADFKSFCRALPTKGDRRHLMFATKRCAMAGNRKAAIDIFLKAAGFLECGVQYVLPQIPQEVKSKLPADLEEAVLQAFSGQALGQCLKDAFVTNLWQELGSSEQFTLTQLDLRDRFLCNHVPKSMGKVGGGGTAQLDFNSVLGSMEQLDFSPTKSVDFGNMLVVPNVLLFKIRRQDSCTQAEDSLHCYKKLHSMIKKLLPNFKMTLLHLREMSSKFLPKPEFSFNKIDDACLWVSLVEDQGLVVMFIARQPHSIRPMCKGCVCTCPAGYPHPDIVSLPGTQVDLNIYRFVYRTSGIGEEIINYWSELHAGTSKPGEGSGSHCAPSPEILLNSVVLAECKMREAEQSEDEERELENVKLALHYGVLMELSHYQSC
eukprot:Gb_40897 [translate_table: standard]